MEIKVLSDQREEVRFEDIYLSYFSKMKHFAKEYVILDEDAENIVQDVFVELWENKKMLNMHMNLIAYLFTTIKNKCLNYLQHLQVREDVNEQLLNRAEWELNTRISTLEACDPDELFTAEAQEIVNKTLAVLPEQTRVVFIMSRYENKSHKTIAETLGITTKGVEYHISKALKKLHTNLKDYYPVFLYLFYIN